MNEQDRHNDRRPMRPEGDIREPRIRRPDLDSDESVMAEREAFFQDFDQAARQQTGEPYYPEDQGYSGQGYTTAPQDEAYDPYSAPRNSALRTGEDLVSQEDYDQPAHRSYDRGVEAESYESDGYREVDSYGEPGAYREPDPYRQSEQGVYEPEPYREPDAYETDGYGEQESYESFDSYDQYDYQDEVEEPEYYSPAPRDDDEAPWQRAKQDEGQPREPNPVLEKAQEIAGDALKGAVLWIRLFFSQDPRRAVGHALKGQEKFSFVPVFLILILIVPIQTLLAFQASAAGLNAQISAFQGLAPVVTPGVVYGSDLLRYVLEFAVLTALYFGLLKLLQTERKIEGAVSAVAVSYFPQIFFTPLAIVLNYVSFTMTSALMTTALLLQFVLLGHGLQETLEQEASVANEEKQRSWFWLFIVFVLVTIIARSFIIHLVSPTLNIL